jgi:hypothetical protein
VDQITLNGFLSTVVLICTASGLIGGAIWKLIKASDKRTAQISAAQTATLERTIERKLDEKLRPIKAELETPSGKTLKDTVFRVGEQMSSMQQTDDRRHRENVAELEKQQGRIATLEDGLRIMRRAFAAVLRAQRPGPAEARIPGLPDEVLVELDRFDEEARKYRSSRARRTKEKE